MILRHLPKEFSVAINHSGSWVLERGVWFVPQGFWRVFRKKRRSAASCWVTVPRA
jgi:hypothetical protein